jgi:hypothetical protein
MKKNFLLLIIVSMTLLSCGESLYLESLYATSIKESYAKYGPENAFDSDKKSAWLTMPGAGPEEGILMGFSNVVAVKKIKVIPADGVEKILSFQIYINGQDFGLIDAGVASRLQTNAKTIFIKVAKVYGFNSENKNEKYSLRKPVGISEIILYDKDDNKINLKAPLVRKGQIVASSVLKPRAAYHTDFLFDSRKGFGWADGNSKKTGIGESLKFIFDERVTIKKIKIWNGYQRSRDHFKKNEAVRTFTFKAEGVSTKNNLKIKYGPEVVELDKPLTGKEFEMKISKIRKGSIYTDLVISELRFSDGKNWFIMQTGGTEKLKQKLISKTKNSVLSKILDRPSYDIINNGDETTKQSIILRSNGSFVIYKDWQKGKDKSKIVADGNWQILSNSKEKAKIKIFGRLHNIAEIWKNEESKDSEEYVGPYKGIEGEERVELVEKQNVYNTEKIFSDVLNINKDFLVSQKGLFANMEL